MIVVWSAAIVAGALVFAALVTRILQLLGRHDLPPGLDEDEVQRLIYPDGNVSLRPPPAPGDDWTKP